MAERIVLDPAEVATSRTALDITPWVDEEGIDWGDAEIQGYMADQSRGAAPVDFRVPNRTITVPLALKTMGGTTFAAARTNIQAKAALFQRERGWLKRVAASGSIVFADVVNATLKLGGGWGQAHRGYDVDAQLVLEAQPDFYGAEVTLPDHSTTTASELVFTETGIQGDYPGRVRIVVDEDDAERQLGLLWGFRSRTYSSAATARLAYNAGTMTPQDLATVVTTTIRHTTVLAAWTPILSTDIIPTGALTHVGTYRVWAQVRSVGGTIDRDVDVRFLWDVGDLSSPVENDVQRVPGADHTYSMDLGEVRLDPAPSGTHRWRGQIQAKAATPPADIVVSKLWLVPVDEGYGVLRAAPSSPSSFSTYRIRDEFDQTVGDLGGKTVQVGGGTWSTFEIGAGLAPTDFQTTGAFGVVNRTALSEAHRGAVAGTASMTNVMVQADTMWSATSSPPNNVHAVGLMARRISQDAFIGLHVFPGTGRVRLVRQTVFSGGSSGFDPIALVDISPLTPNRFYTLGLYVDTAGVVSGWVVPTGSALGTPTLIGVSTDAATGGALATGTTGFFEAWPYPAANTRTYGNFYATATSSDAVLHPSQSAELRWDGNYREDAAGVGWGPVPFVTGDNPRLPPAGLEGRTCEVFVRTSRGDFARVPDNNIDDVSARIFYRPCWLFVS